MKEGISVANLRRSDIEKISNYDYTKYKHNSNNWLEIIGDEQKGEDYVYYGEVKTYTDYFYSPKMWYKNDSKWNYIYENKTGDSSCEYPWEQEFGYESETGKGDTTASTEFKQSYYNHNYMNKEEEFKNSIYYNLLFLNSDKDEFFGKGYWLSTRSNHLFSDFCQFNMCGVNVLGGDCCVGGIALIGSSVDSVEAEIKYALRPVVSINLEETELILNKNSSGLGYILQKS